MAVRFGLYSPSPQDWTAFTVKSNFTGPEGLGYFHKICIVNTIWFIHWLSSKQSGCVQNVSV